MSAPRRSRLGFGALLLLFVLGASTHALLLPLFEGADEGDNLEYIRFIALEGRLSQPTVEVRHDLEAMGRGHMPPLWFASLAPIYELLGAARWNFIGALNPRFLRRRDGEDPEAVLADPLGRLHFRHGPVDEAHAFAGPGLDLRLLRATSVLFGAILLGCVWRTARFVFAERAGPALACTALAAFTPQLQHLSGTLTMDLMLGAFGGLGLVCACAWVDGRRVRASAFAAGAFVGLAAMTKINGLVCLPSLGLAWLLAGERGARRWQGLALCALGFALTAGPYYLWGFLESGHPLWSWKYQQVSPFHNPVSATGHLQGELDWGVFARVLFLTWFADLGWTAVWFPKVVTYAAMAAAGLAALGLLLALQRARASSPGEEPETRPRLLLLVSFAAATMLAAEVWFNLRFTQPQGRHLYPAAAALFVAYGAGLAHMRLLGVGVVAHALCALAALPLLVHHLRPDGWNEEPLFPVTDWQREPRPHLPASEASIAWIGPEEGAGLPAEEPPLFQWRAEAGTAYDLVFAIDNPELTDRPWRRLGEVTRVLAWSGAPLVDRLPLPQGAWDEVQPGSRVHVQVIAIGEDGRATGYSTLRTVRKAD